MKASRNGHAAVVAMLLAVGAAMDKTNTNGKTARNYADSKGHTAVVALLDFWAKNWHAAKRPRRSTRPRFARA